MYCCHIIMVLMLVRYYSLGHYFTTLTMTMSHSLLLPLYQHFSYQFEN